MTLEENLNLSLNALKPLDRLDISENAFRYELILMVIERVENGEQWTISTDRNTIKRLGEFKDGELIISTLVELKKKDILKETN